MDNVNSQQYYNYDYYTQMGYYPQQPATVTKPPEPPANQTVANISMSTTANTVVPNHPTYANVNQAHAYAYGSQEYYNYYMQYCQYYNQYYQQYYNQAVVNAPMPPIVTDTSTQLQPPANETLIQSHPNEGAVNKPVDQSYPQMIYPTPNYSVPPPSLHISPPAELNTTKSWNNTTQQPQHKPVAPLNSAPNTSTISKPFIKAKTFVRPSRFQTQPSPIVQKTEVAVVQSEKLQKNVSPPKVIINETKPTRVWPESLRAYVARAFSSVTGKDKMQDLLKEKLELVYSKNMVDKIDWANEPLPLLPDEAPSNNIVSKKCYKVEKPKTLVPNIKASKSTKLTKSRDRVPSSSSSSSRSSHSRSRYDRKSRKRSRSPSYHNYNGISSPNNKKYIKMNEDRRLTAQSFSHDQHKKDLEMPVVARLSITTKNNGKKGKGKKNGMKFDAELTPVTPQTLSSRASRFKEHLGNGSAMSTPVVGSMEVSWDQVKIVGTCQELEKRYLRLTRAPEPGEVRPLEVLHRSLDHVKTLWYEQHLEYRHICEQMKSIRQDLTVQCIRDQFTLLVYKTHAHICLEASDHEEFNQCQSQIKLLYEEGIPCPDYLEFTAYRLIYYMFTRDHLNIGTMLASLEAHHANDACIAYALRLRQTWSLRNYRRFLAMASDRVGEAPKSCAKVAAWFLDRERRAALHCLAKSYRPWLELQYIADTLGFDTDTDQCVTFITSLLGTGTTVAQLFLNGDVATQKIDMKICAASIQL